MAKFNDFGYVAKAFANIQEVVEKQGDHLHKAASMMADAIQNDKLINVYAGGGHTTLAMGEMFFRAGGLANINPIMETALSEISGAGTHRELRQFHRKILRPPERRPADHFPQYRHQSGNNRRGDGGKEARRENHCRGKLLLAE